MTQCDYCRGVGACPQCWGRAGIDELKEALRRQDALLRRWLDYAQITPGSPPDLHDDTKRELGDSHE